MAEVEIVSFDPYARENYDLASAVAIRRLPSRRLSGRGVELKYRAHATPSRPKLILLRKYSDPQG
jgi:hypothetical protein